MELLLPLLYDELLLLSKAVRARRLETTPLRARLTRLLLDGNPIGDAGAELLCDSVAGGNCCLEALHMRRCGLGERAAVAAGRMLGDSR